MVCTSGRTDGRAVFSTRDSVFAAVAGSARMFSTVDVGRSRARTGSVTRLPLNVKPEPEEVVGRKTIISSSDCLANTEPSSGPAWVAVRLYGSGAQPGPLTVTVLPVEIVDIALMFCGVGLRINTVLLPVPPIW